jgi:hypothetical protein
MLAGGRAAGHPSLAAVQASALLTTSSVSFANWAMISASWLRVTSPLNLWLSHRLLQRRKRDRFAIVMEEAATPAPHRAEQRRRSYCITSPLLTQYKRRVSKHIGTLVWWRICNRGRLKRFDAPIRYVPMASLPRHAPASSHASSTHHLEQRALHRGRTELDPRRSYRRGISVEADPLFELSPDWFSYPCHAGRDSSSVRTRRRARSN